eukprot:CAMPEP_0179044720 /NCGR_PEP_ID=MMETSP0796-20121207/17815_1 /TAXON_ID=73915 /ORGANISM="Pyrodinium bahamense, Strain pbaha01" /LENGTH=112 /DNA_ID=CAMNT_0020741119 /DNA_START=18 /DNA_END=356 /DNA_ORIENTATION=-
MTMVQRLEFVKQRLPNPQPSLLGDAGREAVCPISGKAGVCPMQAMHGQSAAAGGDAGGAAQDQTASEPKPAVCPISGKAGACPMQAMHGQHAATPPVGGQREPAAEGECTIA